MSEPNRKPSRRHKAQAGQGLQPVSPRLPAPLVVQSLQAIEVAVGGRPSLVAALLHAPKTRDLEYVLGLIADPAQQAKPLADLCALGGITPGELLLYYKQGMLAGAQVLATKAIGERLPAVVGDVMRKAADYEDDCPMCQGLTQVTPEPSADVPNPEPMDCPMCQHTGRLRYDGSLEHAKLALSLGKMVEKGGGVNVGVQVNQQHNQFSGGAAGGALERLQVATDRILYGDGGAGPVLEAEVLPDTPADTPPDEAAEEPRNDRPPA